MSKFLFHPFYLLTETNVMCIFGLGLLMYVERSTPPPPYPSFGIYSQYLLWWVGAVILSAIGYFSLGLTGWLVLALFGGSPHGDSGWPAAFSMSVWFPWALPLGFLAARLIQRKFHFSSLLPVLFSFAFAWTCSYAILLHIVFQ